MPKKHDPTQKQIAQATKQIRKGWSNHIKRSRRMMIHGDVPEISIDLVWRDSNMAIEICPKCEGSGEIVCRDCDCSCNDTCPCVRCNNTGYEECFTCDGQGEIEE